MSSTDPGTPPRRARPLDHGERGALRAMARDIERDDPGFAVLLRAVYDGVADPFVVPGERVDETAPKPPRVVPIDYRGGTGASSAVRAWVWILTLFAAIVLGLGAVAVVAATLGPVGLAVGGVLLMTLFIGLVVSVRFF